MRFAFHKFRASWLSCFLAFCAFGARAQVNPHTQVNWPAICSSAPDMVYNFATNTCIRIGGTAANPAGANTQVQFNLNGIFGADALLTFNAATHTFSSQNFVGTTGTFSTVAAATTVSSVNAVLNESLFAGATAALRINAACAAAATPLTPVIVPASETDTTMATPSAHCQVIDYRGTSMPDQAGAFGSSSTVGYTNGIAPESWETRTANPTAYQGFFNELHYYGALRGGTYFYPLGPTGAGSGQKTDYINMAAYSTFDTLAQKSGVVSRSWSTANGETMGIQSYITEAGGDQGNGEEPTEGIRTQMQQMGFTTSTGGASAGNITSITGSGPYTVALSALGIYQGERCCIRDLGTSYSTGTFASITNNSNTPVSGVTSVTITGSGTSWATLGVGSHSTYNSTVSSGGFQLLSTNLCFTISGAQHDGYDVVLPIDSITSNTALTVITRNPGTDVGTGWFSGWPTSGSYTINGCAFPSSFNKPLGTMTVADASGLTVGHAADQSLAYNTTLIGHQMVLTRHIGQSNYGGGEFIYNTSTAGSPYFGSGVAVSGEFFCAFCIQPSSQPTGAPHYGMFSYTRPTTAMISDLTNPSGTGTYDLFQFRDSANAVQHAIQYAPDATAAFPGLKYFGGLASIDTSGGMHSATNAVTGNETVAGTMTASNLSSGPFSNQVLDSNFQSVGASAHTWTSSGGGVTFTQNAGADIFGGTTALEMSGGTGNVIQTTAVAMTAGNTYAASIYAQSASGTPVVSISLHTSGSNTACFAGGGAGIPSSFPISTVLTKYTVYCTATVNDTLRMSITALATSIPIFVSVAQVAGSPWCTTNCTTTGPPAVTTAATISGTGLLASGFTVVPLLLSNLVAQAANTVVANATSGSASPTALAMPSCPSGSGVSSSIGWVNGTGFVCKQTVFRLSPAVAFAATGSNSPAVLSSIGIPIANLTDHTSIQVSQSGHSASGSTACAFQTDIGPSSATATGSGTIMIGSVTLVSAGNFLATALATNQAAPSATTAMAIGAVKSINSAGQGSTNTTGNMNESATGCGSTSTLCINAQITDATNAETCTLDQFIVTVNW